MERFYRILGGSKDVVPRMPPEQQGQIKYMVGGAYVETQCTHLSNVIRLPWWSSDEGFACQCRGHRFDPWSRKIPRATGN